MMTTRGERRLLYVACGVIAIIALATFLPLMAPYPDVARPPSEANRVVHPLGFSIVKPEGARLMVTEEAIVITGPGPQSMLYVAPYDSSVDAATLQRQKFRPGSFQGQAAQVHVGPAGKRDGYQVLTCRGGAWYVLSLTLPPRLGLPGSMPPPGWRRYLQTFVPAATSPATTKAAIRTNDATAAPPAK